MKRMILSLALVVVAGAAVAQSAPVPRTATAPADSVTSAAATAQRRIERDGYTNVRNLAKGPDGLWRGTATRSGTEVQVTVDRSGNVRAQ